MFVVSYWVMCLLGLVGGLLLDGFGVTVGGWIALAAFVAVIPVIYPMPGREDLPWLFGLALGLIPVFFLLKALGAPSWSYMAAGIAGLVVVLVIELRGEARSSGSIRIPPGHRFGAKRRP